MNLRFRFIDFTCGHSHNFVSLTLNLMNVFDSIAEFATSKSLKLSHKVSISLVIIFMALVIDNILGFSYHFSESRKIEIVSEIEQLKQGVDKNSITFFELEKLEAQILKRKNLRDYLSSPFLKSDDTYSYININTAATSANAMSSLWFFVTTQFLFILAIILIAVGILTTGEAMIVKIASIIMISLALGMSAILVSKFCFYILPNPITEGFSLNYLIFGSIQSAVLAGEIWIFLKLANSK